MPGETEIELSSKGQVVIPVKMRKRFGLSRGDKFIAWSKDDFIVLKPITKFSNLRGKYKTKEGTKELIRARQEDLELEKEHHR